jgi:site-specific DNA-methyltransferase (adenine-specific)
MLINGDCLEKLKDLEDNSVDSIVTDPPYGLSFMGKKWDYDVPSKEVWQEAYRVLKPGGYLLSFAGTRTQHRMAVNIEDAGFEIRDMIAWVYGSGFPKSLNIGKAIDKMDVQSELAKQWEGWGTALKPALEPITVARKPLGEKTVAENVLKWGTGGINIDGSRVETTDKYSYPNGAGGNSFSVGEEPDGKRTEPVESNGLGRFPSNLIHDGSDEVVSLFPDTKPSKSANRGLQHSGRHGGIADLEPNIKEDTDTVRGHNDSGGSAARFFYCAKSSKRDRDEGLEGLKEKQAGSYQFRIDSSLDGNTTAPRKNNHPTVKPTKLMQYLVRLVTPKGGVVLDPFMGSGSTGKACKLEGFDFIGIEMDADYIEIAKARINAVNTLL